MQFFSGASLAPELFVVRDVLGFVADLVVDNDPEESWQDYFRKSGQASKSSNESRQKVLYGLSAGVRREVGKKVLDMGGNAVLGFGIHFDLEGTSGLVVRAYGTACRLLRVVGVGVGVGGAASASASAAGFGSGFERAAGTVLLQGKEAGMLLADSTGASLGIDSGGSTLRRQVSHERTHYEDALALAPLPLGVGAPLRLEAFGPRSAMDTLPKSAGVGRFTRDLGDVMTSPEYAGQGSGPMGEGGIFQDEVQLLTMASFAPHVQVRLGGLVVARAVKFLGKLEATLTDQETREGWWGDLRDEIKGHARTLCCSHVVGYREKCSLVGDVCVMSGEGTAAVVKSLSYPSLSPADWELNTAREWDAATLGSPNEKGGKQDSEDAAKNVNFEGGPSSPGAPSLLMPPLLKRLEKRQRPCTAVHVPYKRNLAPFSFMRLVPCAVCRRKWVPEAVLSTTQVPEGLAVRGEPRLLEARVVRQRRRANGEADATKVSEVLPFVEFDLQRQMMLKLKVMGLNAAFGYNSNIRVGANLVVAVASCTAVFVAALPSPPPLSIIPAAIGQADRRLVDMHLHLEELATYHKSVLRRGSEPSRFKRGQGWEVATQRRHQNVQEEEPSSSSSSSSSSDDDESGSSSSSLESPTSSSSSSSNEDDSSSSSSSSEEDERRRKLIRTALRTVKMKTNSGRKKTKAKEGRRARLRRMLLDERTPTVVEVDEETDADIEAVLSDWMAPLGIGFLNLENLPTAVSQTGSSSSSEHMSSVTSHPLLGRGQQIMVLKRENMTERGLSANLGGNKATPQSLAARLQALFYAAYLRISHEVCAMQPCVLLGISHSMHILDDGVLEVLVTAAAHSVRHAIVQSPKLQSLQLQLTPSHAARRARSASMTLSEDSYDGTVGLDTTADSYHSRKSLAQARSRSSSADSSGSRSGETATVAMSSLSPRGGNSAISPAKRVASSDSAAVSTHERSGALEEAEAVVGEGNAVHPSHRTVYITPLPSVPGAVVKRYLGPIHLHFVKDANAQGIFRDTASLEQFFFVFLSEASSVARSQVAALGGNALLCHRMTPQESTTRSGHYNMVSISGDAVLLEYDVGYEQMYREADVGGIAGQ